MLVLIFRIELKMSVCFDCLRETYFHQELSRRTDLGRLENLNCSMFEVCHLFSVSSFRLPDNVLQLQEVGGFLLRFFCGEEFLIYHKFSYGARCRQFLVGAVICCATILLQTSWELTFNQLFNCLFRLA
jgi:hypothetical protein